MRRAEFTLTESSVDRAREPALPRKGCRFRARGSLGSGPTLRRIGWLLLTINALGLALFSARYFSLDPATFMQRQAAVYVAHLGPLLHVTGGVVALAIGPWQFLGGLRARYPVAHRWVGRAYVTASLAAGVGGLLLAPLSLGGPLAHLGFAALAVLLLFTTARALVAIRRRQIAVHRAWMTRSYALVFTAVTFRTWLGGLAATGLPFDQVYAVGSWTSWLINLYVAELLIARFEARAGVSPAPPEPAAEARRPAVN